MRALSSEYLDGQLGRDSNPSWLCSEEEHILANFTQHLIEIAAASGERSSDTSATAVLNAMRLPAIAIDRRGYVADANAAAEVVFDDNIRVKDRRLFVRDPDSRNLLKESIDQLTNPPSVNSLVPEPIIVPRVDKLPGHRADLAVRGPGASTGAGSARAPDVECLGSEAGTATGDHRQGISSYPFRSQTRLHHRARRSAIYRRAGIEDFARDRAQPIEIRLRQDQHAQAKRTRRAAITGPVIGQRPERSNRPSIG